MSNKIQYIVDQIDNSISTLFYFKDIKFWGLSRLEKRQGKTIPVAYEGNSNFKTVGWNDKYGLNIYHRVLSISEGKDNNLGFGKNGLLSSIISMKMIVTGNGKKINNGELDINYKVSDEIIALIPNRFSKTTLTALGIYSLGISANGREFNKQTVYSTEFPDNDESKIKPSDIVFSIDYQIAIKSIDSCQTIACDIDSISSETVCDSAIVTDQGVEVSVASGDRYECEECENCEECSDGSAVLKDSANATISTTAIPSGDTVNITAPDGVASNSNATYSLSVKSNGPAAIPNITVSVNIDGVLNQSVSVVTLDPAAVINISL